LPYLYGINDPLKSIIVISFEKDQRYKISYKELQNELLARNISWKPLQFTKGFGFLGKLWDFCKVYISAIKITLDKKIDVVHARGHVAAQVASFLKSLFKVKFIFDFRGLWADERIDKEGWNLDNILDAAQYRYFKNKEKKLLKHSDHTIVLTKKVVNEIVKIANIKTTNITVIPCCADFNHFSLQTEKKRLQIRTLLKIPENSLVFGYLGSIGPMYLLKDYLQFLELMHQENMGLEENIFGLIITNDLVMAEEVINENVSQELKENIMTLSATRDEVPKILHSLDILVSFISVTYARQAASPTKIAESFATGIPVISNKGVGDVEEQVFTVEGGIVIDDTSTKNLKQLILQIKGVLNLDRANIRFKAGEFLSLDIAIERYKHVYSKIN
jgi:glycosyltransferase involved in cell wall biosynthesis